MPVNICAKSIDSLIVSPTDGRVSFARVTISSSGVVGCWVLVRSLIVPTTAVVVVVKPQFPADRKVVTKKPGQATSQNVQVNSVKLYYHKSTQSERPATDSVAFEPEMEKLSNYSDIVADYKKDQHRRHTFGCTADFI